MDDSAILAPFLAMMLLTLIVWVVMYVRRIGYLVAQRVDPQQLTTPEKSVGIIPEAINYPAYNLRNLFELPVLFYALCLYLYVTSSVDLAYVVAAWTFVAFRALHSLVHCTSNTVMHRFRLYMLAALALWLILVRAVFQFVY